MKNGVIEMLKNGVELSPVTVQNNDTLMQIYDPESIPDLETPGLIDGWTNYYRSDDVSATAYFYLDKPSSKLPELQSIGIRTAHRRRAPNGHV